MVAAVVLWGWLEKIAGVLRGLFTFKGLSFFLFFFPPVFIMSFDHSQKENMQGGSCLLCNSMWVHTRPWVKKSFDLKQPGSSCFLTNLYVPFPLCALT